MNGLKNHKMDRERVRIVFLRSEHANWSKEDLRSSKECPRNTTAKGDTTGHVNSCSTDLILENRLMEISVTTQLRKDTCSTAVKVL